MELKELSVSSRLVEYESQSRELMRAYADVIKRGGGSSSEELDDLISNVQESGSMFKALQTMSEYAAQQYGNMNRLYLEHRAFAIEDVEYMDVVVRPEVADKKSWPVRWLILVTSVGAAVIFTLIGLAIFKK
jgi:capsule polysaccharide export protein KpsE/RkpR